MPKSINGRTLTPAEHRKWKRILKSTGKGGIATQAIKDGWARKKKSKRKKKRTS